MVPVGKLRYSEKKCSSVSLYNINPMWTILGLHPCLHGEKAPVDSPEL